MADASDSNTHTVTFVTNGLCEVEGEGITQNDAGDYVMVVEDGATINAPSSPVQEYVPLDYEIDPTLHFWSWIIKPMDELKSYDDFIHKSFFIYCDMYIYEKCFFV